MTKEKEKLPKGYKIKYRLSSSPMHYDYLLICEIPKKQIAILRFNGIEEYPVNIETYNKL